MRFVKVCDDTSEVNGSFITVALRNTRKFYATKDRFFRKKYLVSRVLSNPGMPLVHRFQRLCKRRKVHAFSLIHDGMSRSLNMYDDETSRVDNTRNTIPCEQILVTS